MKRVIRAAAGCGKTTALAAAYLEFVARGVPVEQIVAITFTRRAAAELVERVGLALRAATGDAAALAALGDTAELYLAAAPKERELASTALADLGSAPIGTTDRFVNQLLAEFALDAELPLPDGRTIALDTGLVAVPSLAAHLDAAARRVLDPPDGAPPDEVALLARYLTLGEMLEELTRADDLGSLRTAGCAEVLGWLGARVAERLQGLDLPAAFKLPSDADEPAWASRLADVTNRGGEWAVPAVATWFAQGAVPERAPWSLVPWIRKVHKGKVRALQPQLEGGVFDFGITDVRMDHVLEALRHPYEDPAHLALADDLRAALDRLRVRVHADALEQAALAGELPHRELTRAAARLTRSPSLIGRFQALLVDEFQDASPDQLDLYEAMSALPDVHAVFVGDGRQSIYLFRGGEPEGLERLTVSTGPDHTVEDLMTNHRSTPELVEAHKALFRALDAPMRAQRFTPPAPFDTLQADPTKAANRLANDPFGAPMVLVHDVGRKLKPTQADAGALAVFWERVRAAWEEPGRGGDTAAVLCPTWRLAREARDALRALSGRDDVAWVQGGDDWVQEGVGRDASLWLRALLDRADDVAWLAVWKHPSIGLTDAALARIRSGVGLGGRGWAAELGRVVDVEALEPPHRDDDRAAFARAAGPLREALASIGRDDTSLVLDRLFTALRWRTALAAGPGGTDDIARLDVLLDWVGELDAQGTGVDAISATLSTAGLMEVPRVRLERPARTILCTTVFQAKGLAWDHVAVLSPGRPPRLEVDPALDGWMQLGGQRVRLAGLRFDPEGGLVPYHDPIRRLNVRIHTTRHAEECARLAYVAVTRARRSVTVALANDFYRPAPLQRVLADAWAAVEHPSVAHVSPPPPLAPVEPPRRSAEPAGPLPTLGGGGRVWVETAPSSSAARYPREHRERIAQNVLARVKLQGGFTPGAEDLPPPKSIRPGFTPADWGTLCHGWFASWRFEGEADPERVGAWLREEWGQDVPEVRAWLGGVSARLASRRGQLWDWVSDPRSKLHFEYPLAGVGGPDDGLLISGRADLLIARPKGVVVVDFKAGDKSPSRLDHLVERASLGTYGPQLDAYRDALTRMGHPVEAVALWFVRTGASVVW